VTVERLRWPANAAVHEGSVAVVTVNHNNAVLMVFLIWSLYSVLGRETLGNIVVVDNGSTDGSVEFLADIASAGLCDLVANADNRQHGPGLNQGLSHLAQRAAAEGDAPAWVWILDSDCVVARPDALQAALARARAAGAAVVGESQPDPWHRTRRFGSHCLLIDPSRTWLDPIAPFEAGGDPTFAFLEACQGMGLAMVEFGFLNDGYVIHRGRGSLARLVAVEDRANPLYTWALDHHEPHFGDVVGAAESYEVLATRFRSAVPDIDASSMISACAPAGSGSPNPSQGTPSDGSGSRGSL
jgi:glycosyltransferase involved in cell wall biosynthesis